MYHLPGISYQSPFSSASYLVLSTPDYNDCCIEAIEHSMNII